MGSQGPCSLEIGDRSDPLPDLPQGSSGRSMWKGASAAMVPRQFRLKFGREMGNFSGRSMLMFGLGIPTPGTGGPKNGFQGYMQPKLDEFCLGLDVAVSFVCNWLGLCSGLGISVGFGICREC